MAKGVRTKWYVDIRGYHSRVTGSCIRNTIHFSNGEKFRFLVDYGVYQGERETTDEVLTYNDSVNPEKIDTVLLTHTHLDHDGALPMFIRNGYSRNIYMSIPTSILLPVSLEDSFNVMKNICKTKKQPMLFKEENIFQTLKHVCAVKYEETISTIHPNINVTFFNNGHLTGSSMILVQIFDPCGERINLLFTGDYKKDNIFLDLNPLPDWVLKLDNLTIITESTYGDTDSKDVEKVWADNIKEACKNDSIIVIPVFAQGRMQEIMYNVKLLQKEGIIPDNYIIEIAGKTGIKYNSVYMSRFRDLCIKEEMASFIPNNIHIVDSKSSMSVRCDNKKPRIIITTSGMGNFGPANSYIPEVLPNPNAVIHFTGYMAEGTLGRKLQETRLGESVTIKGSMEIPRRAKIFSTSEFSSHAKADELIDFINKFNPRAVLVNHGEHEVKSIFAKRVAENTSARKVGILGEGFVYRIDPYGIVKPVKK